MPSSSTPATKPILNEKSYVLREVSPTLERISDADPKNVQQVVASQLALMAVYHNLVLDQAKRSFRWALIAAGCGLLLLLAAIAFAIFQQFSNAAFVSVIGSVLINFISGINFYLYGKTASQLDEFYGRLEQTQRYLLANSICEGLEGDERQHTRAELVRTIAGVTPEIKMQS